MWPRRPDAGRGGEQVEGGLLTAAARLMIDPNTGDPTVFELWAPSCHVCRAMQPALEEVAGEYAGTVDYRRINVSAQPDDALALGVMGTPTLIGIRDGAEVFRHTGRRTPSELRELFTAVSPNGGPASVGREDLLLRLGAGVVVAAIGLAAGPAWPLVALGTVIIAVGLVSWVKRKR